MIPRRGIFRAGSIELGASLHEADLDSYPGLTILRLAASFLFVSADLRGGGYVEIDEPITIVDYDPAWPERFVAERARLLAAFGPENIRIEHFGSTAVPGMAGKPIVDLLVGVSREAQLDSAIDRLVPLGYENFGEIFLSGRHYLRRRGPPHFNVALTVENSQFWGIQMMVREFLRAHPAEVTAYSASKRAAYAGGATLFSTYSQVKAPFLAELLERARAWCRGRATSLTEGSFD